MLVYKSSMDCFTKEGRLTRINTGINKVLHFILSVLALLFITSGFAQYLLCRQLCIIFDNAVYSRR